MKSEDRNHEAECLPALAAFLPKFEVCGLEDDESFDLITDFNDTCYRIGWILYPGFDWSRWKNSPEAIRLHNDPAVLEQATIEQLRWLLTVLSRQDRFCEGTLDNAFKSGLLGMHSQDIVQKGKSADRRQATQALMLPVMITEVKPGRSQRIRWPELR